jgi:hypothetical protein
MRILTRAPLLLALVTLVGDVHGQDGDVKKEQLQRWTGYYQNVAAAYDIRLASDDQTRLQVTAEPVMTYSHPSSQEDVHGAFFLWTRHGRPELIGSIWSAEARGGRRNVVHEFHSLALGPLEPVQVGRRTWRPLAGIELKLIPDAPPPSDSAPLRLAQMRSLARDFTGFSTPHARELTLRTLPQPLYRYESDLLPGQPIVPELIGLFDGGVFCMFADWDPDLILVLEARQADGRPQWHYGIARFNACPMRLEYQGETIWESDLVPASDPTSPFYSAIVESRRLSELELVRHNK